MRRERQVERRFLFGLLWPHISPLQMNINKELLISAACTVRVYVCMQGRHRGAVWTSLPPPLASPPSPPHPHDHMQLYHLHPPPHAHLDYFLFSELLLLYSLILFLQPSLASSPQYYILSITTPYVPRGWGWGVGGGWWYWCKHSYFAAIWRLASLFHMFPAFVPGWLNWLLAVFTIQTWEYHQSSHANLDKKASKTNSPKCRKASFKVAERL